MAQTDESKEAFKETFEFILALMASIFALYPPIKDVFEAKNSFFLENIPLMALSTSVIFAFIVIIGFFLFVKCFNKK